MKVRTRKASDEESTELQMTPMIDVVFQLLIFFMLTLKILPIEGDFTVVMPVSGTPMDDPDILLAPLKIRMKAGAGGRISSLSLAGKIIPGNSFDALHNSIMSQIGSSAGPAQDKATQFEVELDCDYNLKYDYVIKAITAATGRVKYVGRDKQIIKLIQKIKFSPKRK